jgi:hypothetical protein
MTLLSTAAVYAPHLGFELSDKLYAAWILIPFATWFLLSAYSVIYRYRYVSSATERQQTKWAMAGILGSISLFIPFSIISLVYPPSQPSLERLRFIFLIHYPIYILSYLFIPGGIAFAILRYRLWDIDLIIRRTLQYTLLTALLALTYFGGVIILQTLLSPITGGADIPLVTVFTTLVLAALFNPLRRRVQDFIDHRFYRKKYDAEQALAQFASATRDQVDMDRLVAELLEAVEQTVQPERLHLWLKKAKE